MVQAEHVDVQTSVTWCKVMWKEQHTCHFRRQNDNSQYGKRVSEYDIKV